MQHLDYFNARDLANLPTEILIEIFGYLNNEQKLTAGLVCRRWFEATQLLLRRRIILQKVPLLSDDDEPLSTFLNSVQSYQAVTIDNVELGECDKFWQHLHDLEDLEIVDPEIKPRQFVETVKHLTNLKSLRLVSCRDLFMSNKILNPGPSQETLKESLKDLRHLGIVDNRYLSDAFFSRLTTLMPHLESLDLTGCQISFHKGLYRKFYPNSQFNKGASESILTFHFVHEFIAQSAGSIREVNFSRTLIDGDTLQLLMATEGLRLQRLRLASCDQLTNSGLLAMAVTQTDLNLLDLSSCSRVTDQSILAFAENLKALKVLRVKLCRAVTDLGIQALSELPHLEELDVSGCEVTGQGIEKLFQKENRKMKRINLSALSNIHESSVDKLVHMCPYLTVLDLSSSRSGVTNKAVQSIFVNATKLKELILDFCDNITDAGVLGMDLEEEKESSSSTQNNTTTTSDYRISLRSRAEQEIVNEAALKNTMKTMCEAQEGNINLSKSIANLKNLTVLKLTGCNRITDVSLVYCFTFLELHSLTLAKCHQVSTTGVQEMVRNCPSLQILNLSECQSIDDKTVRVIAKEVRRLKELYIDRCHKLTDHSLDDLAQECAYLKVLDVRGCRGMCPEPGLRLTTLRSLRTLMSSKPGPYGEASSSPSSRFPKAPPLRMNF